MSRRVSAAASARVLGKPARLSNVGPTYMPSGIPNGSKPGLLQRRASFHGGKSSQPRTDPRPLNDRSFQQECIRTLTGYLMMHGYTVAISPKLLVSPASKDILNIVQFLFQKHDPHMKLLGKVEEDVPVVFKRLGYPFQISKSALYAAGSPHTWPGLLAALEWFVDLQMHQESAEVTETIDEPFSSSAFENLYQSYQRFLAGDDDECERLDSAFRQQFEDYNGEIMEKVAKLQSKVSEAEEHLHRLSTEASPLVSLESKKTDFLSDKKKFSEINSRLLWHKQAAEKKLEERKEDLLAKKAEKKALQADIEELRGRIGAQEINLAEVERMQKEENLLEVNIQPIASKEQQLRKGAWGYELASTNKVKDLDVLLAEYNEHCQRLRPTLAEGQSLSGAQFQITLQPEKTVPLEIRGTSVPAGSLKAALLEVTEICRRHTEQEKKETMACKLEVYEREATRQEKLDFMSQRIATMKKVEALYKASKDKWDVEVAALVNEREELEAKVAAKELVAKRTDADAEELVKHWEQKYEAESAGCAKQLASTRKEWLEVVDLTLSAKEHMRERLGNLKTTVHADADRVKHELSGLLSSMLALQV